MKENESTAPADFIRDIVATDVAAKKHDGRIHTRFPPEPNGYLHIGHAKSICLNFGIAAENAGGCCNLRFDDTNPVTEEPEYVESIKADVAWLGFDWSDREYYASQYFETLYESAVGLIKRGKAFVCSLTESQIRDHRGTLTEPGSNSPDRDRAVAENLDLFGRMRAGEFEDGVYVLRAKIDMAHSNIHMRDPIIYRIRHAEHHFTGSAWCIYPMYDYAHPISDAIERITHSLCTLEFEIHRPLYDWFVNEVDLPCRPRQIEFARLNLSYTVMSKRRLLELVRDGNVSSWDDPRMPTLSGIRRRGFTPEAIRNFCRRIGVTKYDGITDIALLEHCVRDDLNKHSPRAMAVLNPLRVVIENYSEEHEENLAAINNPEDDSMGIRQVPFSRVLYIEQDDFMEDPPKKFFRLAPGREVRLRYAYYITCTGVDRDPATGQILQVRCNYDPATKGGSSPDGRKVKGTLHWVSAVHAVDAQVRLYDRLFTVEDPLADTSVSDYRELLNPNSLEIVDAAKLEPGLADAAPGARFQFERLGYFCVDRDTSPQQHIFNRTLPLRDSWAKIRSQQNGKQANDKTA